MFNSHSLTLRCLRGSSLHSCRIRCLSLLLGPFMGISFVKLEMWPVKEATLLPSCPKEWPKPEQKLPNQEVIRPTWSTPPKSYSAVDNHAKGLGITAWARLGINHNGPLWATRNGSGIHMGVPGNTGRPDLSLTREPSSVTRLCGASLSFLSQ